MRQAGLTQVKTFPQFAAFDEKPCLQSLQGDILPTLAPDAVQEWRTAVAQAEADIRGGECIRSLYLSIFLGNSLRIVLRTRRATLTALCVSESGIGS